MTAAQVSERCAARDRTRRHIEEGFGLRNHPQWARFDEVVSQGRIGPGRAVHATWAKQSTLQIERFSRRLLGEAVPSGPIEDALNTSRTIEARFESARSGCWQALPT